MSKTGLSAHGDLVFRPSVCKTGVSAHHDRFFSQSVSKTGLSTHGDLLSVPVGTDRWVAGYCHHRVQPLGFSPAGPGAPSLAPAGPDGRKPSSATLGQPHRNHRRPTTVRYSVILDRHALDSVAIGSRSNVLAGDNRHHYRLTIPSVNTPPRAGWRISRCPIVISVISPSPSEGRATLS